MLWRFGPAGKAAVPALLRILETNYDADFAVGTDDTSVGERAWQLHRCRYCAQANRPEAAAKALGDSITNARFMAWQIWPNDPDDSTGRAATNALKNIDPKAAAKAGVK